MNEIPIWMLGSMLVALLCCSAFFSGSETGMMTLNPYRLRHMSARLKGARRASKLLRRPDRLLGVILIGNNLANNLAAVVTTILAIRLFGNGSETLAAIVLTLVMLVFAEVAPKTIAAAHPERIAFPASVILYPLLKILYPVVWVVNHAANHLVRLFRVDPEQQRDHSLSREELRAVVDESRGSIHQQGQGILINVLDLDQVTVNDIMVSRKEIAGLNLEDDTERLIEQIIKSKFSRLPVFEGNINNVVGVLHMRKVGRLLKGGSKTLTREAIKRFSKAPYFVPENTSIPQQLANFRQNERHMGIVVDEYGVVQGLVTLKDIFEEIVGDFAHNLPESNADDDIVIDQDAAVVRGITTLRDINKATGWGLPTKGPKTLNGLALELLESIPHGNVCFEIEHYRVETLALSHTMIAKARVWQSSRPPADPSAS